MTMQTRYKKAMKQTNLNIRLAKMHAICLQTLPGSRIFEKAMKEATRLRELGAKYW